MIDLNHVVLIGRLTRDAELKSIANGQSVCKFSIAVNRRKKNGDQWEDEPNFFDIVVWGRQGESLHPYLVKGKMIGVDGELRQDRWQQDGQNRSKIEIIANYLQLLGSNPSGGPSAKGAFGNSNGTSGASFGQAYQSQSSSSADDNYNDDVPF